MKKYVFLFLLTLLPMMASADSGTCGDNLTWTYVEATNTLTISGNGGMSNYTDSNIPWSSFRSSIRTVVIQNGVTSIGSYAFYNCRGLTSVTIPNSVTSIGSKAFSVCSGLTSVTIPNSVTSIGSSAFEGTPFYNNMADGVIYLGKCLYKYKGTMPENTTIVIADGTISISRSAFYSCSGLTSVTIPNSVTSIGNNAFEGTPFYNNMADGVIYLGKCLYKYKGTMPENTAIVIADGTISISPDAFFICTGLTSITIPNSVTSIGSEAFWYCI